jgi:hypothetical protein
MQISHAHRFYGTNQQFPRYANVGRLPAFARCRLGAGYYEPNGEDVYIDLSELPEFGSAELVGIAALTDALAIHLNELGIATFARRLFAAPDQTCFVEQVIAPALERFHLVSHGIPVAPGPRGELHLSKLAISRSGTCLASNGDMRYF